MGDVEPGIGFRFVGQGDQILQSHPFGGALQRIVRPRAIFPSALIGTVGAHQIHKTQGIERLDALNELRVKYLRCETSFIIFMYDLKIFHPDRCC